jgi:hypothetical protein
MILAQAVQEPVSCSPPGNIRSLRANRSSICFRGNAAAQIFYLKARGGWTEKLELTGKDGGPITLAAMREAFAAEIEGTAKPVSKKKAKQITDESESND